MLTRKQYELLVFIDQRLRATGVSPSFDEMKDALSLRSKSGIHRLITGLEERGFIRRLAHRARALEVVRLPENASDSTLPPPSARFTAVQQMSPDMRDSAARTVMYGRSGGVTLPLYGKIAAGVPIEALRDNSAAIEVPASFIGRGGVHYALTVEGDSMVDAGILDGDIAVIRKVDVANNGDVIVALIDDLEVTLKRLRRQGGAIILEPANARYEPRILAADRVKIQGKLSGILRFY